MSNLQKIKSLGRSLNRNELSEIIGGATFYGSCNNGTTFSFQSNYAPGDNEFWYQLETVNNTSCQGSGINGRIGTR